MTRFTTDVSYGDYGSGVKNLQDFLEWKGYGIFHKFPVRFFGDTTYARVKEFQKDNDISPISGYFGPLSRAVANKMIADNARSMVYDAAISCLGTDASPNDIAPDEYGCAETVSDVLIKSGVDMPVFVSTYQLYQFLSSSPTFIAMDQYLPGDVIISPTGMGNGTLPNGHTGIVGNMDVIMSNDSSTGLFNQNYSIESWKNRYQKMGGYPVFFFGRLY